MKNYHFSDDQINLILDSLSKQPYINVFELINNIQQQYSQQIQIQNNTEHSEGE